MQELTTQALAQRAAQKENKEAQRQQVLAQQGQLPAYNRQACETTATLVKAANAAARQLLPKPRKTDQSKKVVQHEGLHPKMQETKKVKQKVVVTKPKRVTKAKRTTATQQRARTNKAPGGKGVVGVMPRTVKSGGCMHCHLNGLKSFTRAGAKWYLCHQRYLCGMVCKDCKVSMDKLVAKGESGAIVYYCDQGIQGFDAPDDDPMKAVLTCDLVLCAHCESTRRIDFDKATPGRASHRGRSSNK